LDILVINAKGPSPRTRETKPGKASVTLSKNSWGKSILHEMTTSHTALISWDYGSI